MARMTEPVWVGLDAEIGIFLEDSDGVATGLSNQSEWNHREYGYDTPIFDYCYWQGIRVESVLEAERKAVPGLINKKIITRGYSYEVAVDSWYFSKTSEFDVNDMQDRAARFTVVMVNHSPYKGSEDQIFMRGAIVKSVKVVTKEGNPVQEAAAVFWAESFE
jgi:hypothetical protein